MLQKQINNIATLNTQFILSSYAIQFYFRSLKQLEGKKENSVVLSVEKNTPILQEIIVQKFPREIKENFEIPIYKQIFINDQKEKKKKEKFNKEFFSEFLTAFLGCYPVVNSIQCKSNDSQENEEQIKFLNSQMIKNSIDLSQFNANTPIEDRHKFDKLSNLKNAYLVQIFDGHGGWQLAEFAQKNLGQFLDQKIKALKENNEISNEDELICKAFDQAFDEIEFNFQSIILQAYQLGFGPAARVGSCALCVLIYNNKLYTANLGDSKGILFSKTKNSIQVSEKLTRKLNANSKKEQKRLKETFPTDSEIIVCRKSHACYVKGRLMPTRSFGDFHLKSENFNNPQNFDISQGFRSKLKNFNPPYITHKPEIKISVLNKDHKYVVLGSDGLWDELHQNDIAKILTENSQKKKARLSEILIKECLNFAATRKKITLNELLALPANIKRKHYDDVTVAVIDLKNLKNSKL